jgi:hypothetical protein
MVVFSRGRRVELMFVTDVPSETRENEGAATADIVLARMRGLLLPDAIPP